MFAVLRRHQEVILGPHLTDICHVLITMITEAASSLRRERRKKKKHPPEITDKAVVEVVNAADEIR